MYLHGLRDSGRITSGDKIELKNIPVSIRKIVAGIILNAGYFPILYSQPFLADIGEEIPEEGEKLLYVRKLFKESRKKNPIKSKSKRKICKCKK